MSGGVLTEGVPVRFPQEIAEAARRIADSEGMTLSAWIRREVDREVSRREGRCHACGQGIPAARSVMTVEDDAECEWLVPDADDDEFAGACGTQSRFIVERSGTDRGYEPSESCEQHLAGTVAAMVAGDEHVQAIVSIRWDKS